MSSSVKYIPGEGPLNPKVLFIGEAPGQDEDTQGRPFVGKSGKLLTLMIEFIGLKREDVYITNVCKVRPDNNRTPTDEEVESWQPLLIQEIESLWPPPIIVTLGNTALKSLFGRAAKIGEYRGTVFTRERSDGNINRIVPTYHPSYLLRNPSAKDIVKQDLLKAKELLNGSKN